MVSFAPSSFARHIELKMAAILGLKPWQLKKNFFKDIGMLYPIVTDQICTGKKLWGLILCHILATFHILSKFAITTKKIPHSTGLFKSFSRAGSPLQ